MQAIAVEDWEGVKWLKHYSTKQRILIVGDGDFSFSLALATAFGSGKNLVATSLDSYVDLSCKYSKAISNVAELERIGATVLHGVDVTTMKLHTFLQTNKFDRIVFNFPHAGFNGKEDNMINSHQVLLRGFFSNAVNMIEFTGQIHISHKTGHPYDAWNMEQLASESSLTMFEKVPFEKYDYPGYNQKRGASSRSDEPFLLGVCCTFKFHMTGVWLSGLISL